MTKDENGRFINEYGELVEEDLSDEQWATAEKLRESEEK